MKPAKKLVGASSINYKNRKQNSSEQNRIKWLKIWAFVFKMMNEFEKENDAYKCLDKIEWLQKRKK